MPFPVYWSGRRAGLQLAAVALLGLAAACGGSDQLSPSTQGEVATGDSLVATPTDSVLTAPDSTLVDAGTITPENVLSSGVGLPFGMMNMRSIFWTTMYNTTQLGALSQYLLDELVTTRSKGGQMIVKMAGQKDYYIQNSDGTFNLSKWKAQVDNYRKLNLSSYISDGTLSGHFLIDEPQNVKKWGGKAIPQSTVEEMARYSKQIWPTLPTFARVVPSWLAQSSITYTYLDAGWAQYVASQGEVTQYIASEVAAAKRKGLGLMAGMNILGGGNGSSGYKGYQTKWAMSATEIRNYGTAILNQSYVCGFINWTYLYSGATYFARSDIKSAVTDLSNRAKAHPRTLCRQ
ncbi:MAG: hypothetical protein ACJ8BF_01200 [Gemmatimonadales bacterium]